MLNAKNKEYAGGDNFKKEVLGPGVYPGRLVQVIDMGVQEQRAFKGEAKPPTQELMVTYELADEFMKDEEGNELEDKPRWISESFPLHNLRSDLAKSTKRYYALDPECVYDGDWTKLVGMPVMITIVNDVGTGKNEGKVYENIASTSSMRKKEADKLPELKNPAKVFDQDNAETAEIMLTLPQWIQDKIKGGVEWEGSPMANTIANLGKKGTKDAKPKNEDKPVKKARNVQPEPEEDVDAIPTSEDDGDAW